MIITLTPNPGLDKTLQIDRLDRGAVNRAHDGQVDPGGKGVNVSRALAAHGIKSTAVLPLGGRDGALMGELLAAAGVAVRTVAVAGELRTNITLAEPDGLTTKINEPGPGLGEHEVAELVEAVLTSVTPGCWVACCGSLPTGVSPGFYADLIEPLRRRGAQVVLDTSGAALQKVLAGGGALPDLVKPNLEELAEAVGRPLRTLGDVLQATDELLARGVTTVLASLGADGAVLATGGSRWYGSARVARPRSTVGAGDAMLAGYLALACAPGADDPARPAAALRNALAWGSAATTLPGSQMPGPGDAAQISVTIHEHLDPTQALTLTD